MMMKISRPTYCLIACGLAFAPAAHADLSYVQTTSSSLGGMMGGAGAQSNLKYFSKGEKQRMETTVMGMKTITLTKCGSLSSTLIDTKNRIYTVQSGTDRPALPGGKKIGPTAMTVKVTNLGTTTIAGQKAPHYRIDMTMKMQGRSMNAQTEIWSSKTPMPSCPGMTAEVARQMTKNLGMFGGGSNVKVNGDMKSLAGAFRMVPLRQKISMNGMEFATVNTTKISTAPVSSSLFAPPAGYRKVSSAQYQEIQQKAMHANMGEMFKSMPKMGR